MCLYITAILPERADVEALSAIFKSVGMDFHPTANSDLQANLRDGELQVLTTRGHCDCETELGTLNRADDETVDRPDDHVGRLRKKGWSEAKIDRWLGQKAMARDNDERARESLTHYRRSRGESMTLTAEEWKRHIARTLEGGYTPWLGLFLHMYQATIDTERLTVHRRERIPLASLTVGRLQRLRPDVIYEFHPGT